MPGSRSPARAVARSRRSPTWARRRHARREAEDALQALAPRLAEARELERERAIASERASAARRRAEDCAGTLASRRAAREALAATRAEHEGRVGAAAAGRRAQAEVDALHDEDVTPPWGERIERARALRRARDDARGQRVAARDAFADRERALAADRQETSRWSEALARAEQRVIERRAALAREPGPDLVRGAIRRLASSLDALARAAEHAGRAELAAAREDEHARGAAAAARAEEDARARLAHAESELASLVPALGEAERTCELARAQLQLADRRAELREGEECPLCGATDHPFARHAPATRLLDALEARALELRGRIDVARGDLARAESESTSAARALAWALREQGRAERERSDAELASGASMRAADLDGLAAWSGALDAPLRALIAGAAPARLAEVGPAPLADAGPAGPGAAGVRGGGRGRGGLGGRGRRAWRR